MVVPSSITEADEAALAAAVAEFERLCDGLGAQNPNWEFYSE